MKGYYYGDEGFNQEQFKEASEELMRRASLYSWLELHCGKLWEKWPINLPIHTVKVTDELEVTFWFTLIDKPSFRAPVEMTVTALGGTSYNWKVWRHGHYVCSTEVVGEDLRSDLVTLFDQAVVRMVNNPEKYNL